MVFGIDVWNLVESDGVRLNAGHLVPALSPQIVQQSAFFGHECFANGEGGVESQVFGIETVIWI